MLQLPQNIIQAMLALGVSVALHIGLFMAWSMPIHERQALANHVTAPKSLIVQITNAPLIAQPPEKKLASASSTISTTSDAEHALTRAYQTAQSNSKKPSTTPLMSDYLSPKQVDINAIPLTNIDSAMLPNTMQQQRPIRLRLYVDQFGHVTKTKRLETVQASDEAFAVFLETWLRQTPFIPAKSHQVEVKAYQDVEFNMN